MAMNCLVSDVIINCPRAMHTARIMALMILQRWVKSQNYVDQFVYHVRITYNGTVGKREIDNLIKPPLYLQIPVL